MKHRMAIILSLSLVSGCGVSESRSVSTPPAADAGSDIDGTRFLLTEEPEGGRDVVTVREDAQDQDDIVIVGRIGGSRVPWVEGRAAFSIVDRSLKACSDIPGDTCEFPWDYCCETEKLATGKVLVKFLDDEGKLLKADARQLLNVEELQTVVVQGKAKRDDAGNLTVLANGLFVRNSK